MRRLGFTCALATLLSGCFSDQKTDSVHELLDAGVLGKDYAIVMNYSVSGWDFYSNVGLIEIREQPQISCNKKYRATVEILINQLEHDFQVSAAPNKSMFYPKNYPVNSKNMREVCEVVIRSENGEWFGALILDRALVYFEDRNKPYDLSTGFHYVK